MTLRSKGGFTLIELLVVIAIIGILSAIVLTAVGSVRNNAKVANIQATLRNAQTAGEIYYNSNSFTYANICIDPQIEEMMDSMRNQGALVGCWEPRMYSSNNDFTNLAKQDWALTVYFNHNNYSVNPQGVVTFDTNDIISGTRRWNTSGSTTGAVDLCANEGKRLPSVAQLRALYVAHGNAPPAENNHYQGGVEGGNSSPRFGFTASVYWSGLEVPPGSAWLVYLSFGDVDVDDVTLGGYVRCVS